MVQSLRSYLKDKNNHPTTYQRNHPKIATTNKKKQINEPKKVLPNNITIVLLHGLNRISSDFAKMQKALKSHFPNIEILAAQSLDKDKAEKKGWINLSPTVRMGIREQAKQIYEEMKIKIQPNRGVIIIGHSQGGLRGFTLINDYANQLKKEKNIICHQLITIGTPWKGAPVMECLVHPDQVIAEINSIGQIFNKIENKLSDHLASLSIPIKAIGTICTDFKALFPNFPTHITQSELDQINHTYGILIQGGKKGEKEMEHDMLLPIATQHGIGLAKNDFETIKIYGSCHGNKVGMRVKPGIAQLNHDQVIQTVINLVQQSLDAKP